MLFAIEAGMPSRVAGEVNDTQTVPNIQEIAIIKQSIRGKGSETKEGSTEVFKNPRNPCQTGVARAPSVVRQIKPGSSDPCAGLPGQMTDVGDMIQMSMSDDDARKWFPLPSSLPDGAPQSRPTADETCVQED